MSDIRQTEEWSKFLSTLSWKTEKVGNNFVYIRPLPLIGSLIKLPRASWPVDFKQLDKLSKTHRALFVKLEPKIPLTSPKALTTLTSEGYQPQAWTLAPTKTAVLDLTKSEETLLKGFEKDTRYSINLAIRRGVRVKESTDFDLFYSMYKQTAKRKRFWIGPYQEVKNLYQAFKDQDEAVLLFAYNSNSESIAVCLILFNPESKTAFYHMAATSPVSRELMAPYLLAWEAMKLAKKKGFKYFDFDGLKDDRYTLNKNWGGFSLFKKGFRGEEVTYLGSFVKYYNPILKLLAPLFDR